MDQDRPRSTLGTMISAAGPKPFSRNARAPRGRLVLAPLALNHTHTEVAAGLPPCSVVLLSRFSQAARFSSCRPSSSLNPGLHSEFRCQCFLASAPAQNPALARRRLACPSASSASDFVYLSYSPPVEPARDQASWRDGGSTVGPYFKIARQRTTHSEPDTIARPARWFLDFSRRRPHRPRL